MQVIRPDAPISAAERVPLKKVPEHSPTADSSRFTGTWMNRLSVSSVLISSAIQSSGRLATSLMSAAASSSVMRLAASFTFSFKSKVLGVCQSQFFPYRRGHALVDTARLDAGTCSPFPRQLGFDQPRPVTCPDRQNGVVEVVARVVQEAPGLGQPRADPDIAARHLVRQKREVIRAHARLVVDVDVL